MRERPVVVRDEREIVPSTSPSFRDVFLTYYPAVFRHLLYLSGDRQVAEDLTQETFTRLFQQADPDASQTLRNPRAWLLTVASNLAYNHFRNEKRRLDRERRPKLSVLPGGAAEAYDQMDDVLDVRGALATLEPRDRAVLLLRHSGFSYAEIADAVGLQTSSVGTTLARAQRRFRETYGRRERRK